jgi:hypothetical protein
MMSRNACYHTVQSLLSSSFLSKNITVEINRTVILPVVFYGCETWSITLREERGLGLIENRLLRISNFNFAVGERSNIILN